jgi:hypothetical protein
MSYARICEFTALIPIRMKVVAFLISGVAMLVALLTVTITGGMRSINRAH